MARTKRINNPQTSSDTELATADRKIAKLSKDGGIIIGSSTDSNNVKLHRGGSNTLEIVTGVDTTSEGSTSSNKATLGVDTLKVGIRSITRSVSGNLQYSPDGVASPTPLSNGTLGDVKTSILGLSDFQTLNGTQWVLMDGQSIVGSDLNSLFPSITNAPDARGLFLRAKNNGRSDGNQDTGGERTLGVYQAEATKLPTTPFTTDNPGTHTHSYSDTGGPPYNGDIVAGTPNLSQSDSSRTTGAAGAHTHTITGGGDLETRPKNIAVNYFIKINN